MTSEQKIFFQLNGENPMLARNYDSLQKLIKEGAFDFEKFGIEDNVKNYAQQFKKIADEIAKNNYTPELKLQLKTLNKDFSSFDIAIKNRIKIFDTVANQIKKAIGAEISYPSVSVAKYFTNSPEYLGLKGNVNNINNIAKVLDASQQQAMIKTIQTNTKKQGDQLANFGKLIVYQAGAQILNDIFEGAAHVQQVDQQLSLMRKDYRAAYNASIKKRNIDAIKNIVSDAAQYGAIGATIGTSLGPGIGTAVGAGIGAGIGVVTGGVKTYFNKDISDEELQKQVEQIYQANKYIPADMLLNSDNRFYTDIATAYGRNKESNIKDIRNWLKESEDAYNKLTNEINEKTAIIKEFNAKKESGTDLTADELTIYARTSDQLSQLTKKQSAEYSRKRSLETIGYDYENYAFNKRMYNDSFAYQNAAIEYARNQTLGLRAGSQKDYIVGKFTSQDTLNSLLANSQKYTGQLKGEIESIDVELKLLEGYTDILSENKVKALQARRRQVQNDIYKEEDYQHGINDQLWQSKANIFNLYKSLYNASFSGRAANTLSNPFVQLNDIESLFAESLGRQMEIKRKINEITSEDELSLTKKAKLIDEYNQMASQANQIKSARDQQYNQILAGVASSKYLTNNLGSFGRWAGTNDASATLTRLTSQQNSLLQKILDALLSEDRGMYYQ